jgi:dienelactone hydrolase
MPMKGTALTDRTSAHRRPCAKARRYAGIGAVTAGALAALAVGTAPAQAAPAQTAPAAHSLVRVHLPTPTGPDAVGTTELHLVQHGRPDPWKSGQTRQIMASIFYPARDARRFPLAHQMAPGAAAGFDAFNTTGVPPGTVDWAATRTAAHLGAPVDRGRRPRPVVLYSPGVGDPRTWGTTLVEDLASRGYIVVTVDHTYDATAVQFPDGHVAKSVFPAILAGGPPTPAFFRKVVRAREDDTRFVLDELGALDAGADPDAEHRPLPPGLRGALDLHRIAMFGQSGGGFTALQTMYDDPRVKAAIDMDGQLSYSSDDNDGTDLSSVAEHGLRKPFLLMGSQAGGRHAADNRSWAALWNASRGWHRDLYLTGSGHGSYTDGEALLPQIARRVTLPPGVLAGIGSVDPAAAVAANRAYVAAFFDRWLRHRDDGLLDGPSARFPQMTFVR